MRRKVKDPDLLWLMDVFIDHPVPWTAPGKGIPIGNLTSQHFANFYLSELDHCMKERLRIKGYIRYMDDLVLFANEKHLLWHAALWIEEYLRERLRLRIKEGSLILASVSQGLPYLGFRIFPAVIRIQRQGWRRFRRKARQRCHALGKGKINTEQWMQSMASLVGHLAHGATRNLRASFFRGQGQKEAPTGRSAAAVGTTTQPTAGRRSATTIGPTTAMTTWAFASPVQGNGPMRCVYGPIACVPP